MMKRRVISFLCATVVFLTAVVSAPISFFSHADDDIHIEGTDDERAFFSQFDINADEYLSAEEIQAITEINLSGKALGWFFRERLQCLTNLRSLVLENCSVDDSGYINCRGGLHLLANISIRNCNISGLDCSNIGQAGTSIIIADCPNMTNLNLCDSKVLNITVTNCNQLSTVEAHGTGLKAESFPGLPSNTVLLVDEEQQGEIVIPRENEGQENQGQQEERTPPQDSTAMHIEGTEDERELLSRYDIDANGYLVSEEIQVITEIKLSGKALGWFFRERLQCLTNLSVLELDGCSVDANSSVSCREKLHQLKKIVIKNCNISFLDLSNIGVLGTTIVLSDCPNLESLFINGTVVDSITITNCNQLTHVSAGGSGLTEKDFSNVPSISDLRFDGGIFRNDDPEELEEIGEPEEEKPHDPSDIRIRTGTKDEREYLAQFDRDENGYLSQEELKSITEVNLKGKTLGWFFQNNLSSLVNLHSISLEDCYIETLITMERLHFLKNIVIKNCSVFRLDFSGIGEIGTTVEIVNCNQLTALYLKYSKISHLTITDCDNIKDINGQGSGLTKDNFPRIPSLRSLWLDDENDPNNRNGKNYANPEGLWIGSSGVTHSILSNFDKNHNGLLDSKEVTNVKELRVVNECVDGTFFEALKDLSGLQFLSFDNCTFPVGASFYRYVYSIPLTVLELKNCSEITSLVIGDLSSKKMELVIDNCPDLYTLIFDNCRIGSIKTSNCFPLMVDIRKFEGMTEDEVMRLMPRGSQLVSQKQSDTTEFLERFLERDENGNIIGFSDSSAGPGVYYTIDDIVNDVYSKQNTFEFTSIIGTFSSYLNHRDEKCDETTHDYFERLFQFVYDRYLHNTVVTFASMYLLPLKNIELSDVPQSAVSNVFRGENWLERQNALHQVIYMTGYCKLFEQVDGIIDKSCMQDENWAELASKFEQILKTCMEENEESVQPVVNQLIEILNGNGHEYRVDLSDELIKSDKKIQKELLELYKVWGTLSEEEKRTIKTMDGGRYELIEHYFILLFGETGVPDNLQYYSWIWRDDTGSIIGIKDEPDDWNYATYIALDEFKNGHSIHKYTKEYSVILKYFFEAIRLMNENAIKDEDVLTFLDEFCPVVYRRYFEEEMTSFAKNYLLPMKHTNVNHITKETAENVIRGRNSIYRDNSALNQALNGQYFSLLFRKYDKELDSTCGVNENWGSLSKVYFDVLNSAMKDSSKEATEFIEKFFAIVDDAGGEKELTAELIIEDVAVREHVLSFYEEWTQLPDDVKWFVMTEYDMKYANIEQLFIIAMAGEKARDYFKDNAGRIKEGMFTDEFGEKYQIENDGSSFELKSTKIDELKEAASALRSEYISENADVIPYDLGVRALVEDSVKNVTLSTVAFDCYIVMSSADYERLQGNFLVLRCHEDEASVIDPKVEEKQLVNLKTGEMERYYVIWFESDRFSTYILANRDDFTNIDIELKQKSNETVNHLGDIIIEHQNHEIRFEGKTSLIIYLAIGGAALLCVATVAFFLVKKKKRTA